VSEIVGEAVSEDLTVQSLFLDVGREFKPSAHTAARSTAMRWRPYAFAYMALATDAAIAMGAGAFASGSSAACSPASAWIALGAIALTALWLAFVAKMYQVEIVGDYTRYLRYFAQSWCLAAAIAICLNAVLQIGGSSGSHHAFNAQTMEILSWLTFWGASLAAARFALAALFRYGVKQDIVAHDVVILGATDLAVQFVQRAAADGLGVRTRAIFDDNFSTATPREIGKVPVLGGVDDLLEYTMRNEITDVVIAMPLREDDRITNLLRRLSMQPLKVSIIPPVLSATLRLEQQTPASELPGIPVTTLIKLPIDPFGRIVKGALDRGAALFALLLFGPVMIVCAIGIKLTSPGKVFYLQRRIGYRNAEFTVFKFRSMHENVCNTGMLTVRDDPRVFAFGLFMRKFSLDELPQLFNVLRGDMSLVGPRPHMPEAKAAGQLYFEAVPEYPARHRVKPGITGWAQVSGWRGPTETLYQIEQRVLHDLHYIENWSLWLDVKILVKTCLVGFFGQNAF
jgi:Undecaprenyl-phosphate glucose phosphotransferase